MKRPDDSVLFGIRKGIAIYFNDVIEKDRIKEIVRMLVDMTGVTFTGKQAQGEPKIQLVRGGWERVFDNTFKSSTFESSNVLMLTDGTKDALQKFLQTVKYANSKWTEWFYLGFAVNREIYGPNIIQFLSDRLWERVEQSVRQCDFSWNQLNNGVILDILDHKDGKLLEPEKEELFDRLSKLHRALYPIIVPAEKPMFLKENEWVTWQNRFE